MSILRVFLSGCLKVIAAGLFVFGYISAVVWALEVFYGYTDYPRVQDVFKHIFVFTFAAAACLWILSKFFRLIGAGLFGRFFAKSFGWFVVGSFAFIGVFTSMVFYQEVRDTTSIFMMIVISMSTILGGYIAYVIAGSIVGYLGWQFEMLGNALPKGRSVLFSEALNSGYSKPQARAFINELSRVDGGVGYVYTTFILYVIPALALIMMVTDMLFFKRGGV